MSVDYKVRQIYNEVIKEVTKTPEAWQSVLRLAGQIYRYEFDNVLMVYAQKRYVFDISDTGGKQSQLTWNLEGENAKDFMEYQMYHGRYESPKEAEKEDVLIALKTFTK